MKIVIAVGGNAMQQPGQVGTHEVQYENVRTASESIAKIIALGHDVILTSGNGPQVGAILLQNQNSASISPEMPLFCCGAMSQGLIGYWMTQCMRNVLGLDKNIVCTLTQTIVDINDPAFENPTKPVGRFYSKEEADKLISEGKKVKEDAGRGYRVVVPSPRPQKILETAVIKQLSDSGALVICTNGGGVPVIEKAGQIAGVDAVIDKDLATSLLARDLKADVLMILTDVTNACINYKQPNETQIGKISYEKMLALQAEGHFKAGSMGPKVAAALEFANFGGKAIITSLNDAVKALEGQVGTIIAK
ncbi:Carbamate kinase [Spironucleus salmonicida]|uniref:Carbamate kinase n=1 Tax=Spironucleus salmonicida TaxID=348837 RepID=V6LGR7_9EUKA|nr:Carbamate kinase [Spironucleus salmonicida]|eukprot:EST43735.1 Carbamate kinase [Spironucleus salmonicida]